MQCYRCCVLSGVDMTQLDLCGLADDELVCQLKKLVGADRALNVKLLVHLGELDERGVCRAQGYASTFEYAVRALHMSDAEAYLRIHAARLGRRFPRVLELFGQGELHLTAIKLLGPILTADNHVQVLERARRKSKREIELLVAELAPKPDVPARMRKLPATRAALAPSIEAPVEPRSPLMTMTEQHSSFSVEPAAFALQAPQPRATSTPQSPGRFKLEVMLDQAAHDKLEQLRALLRHQVPHGDLGCVIERALDALLEQTLKRRFAQTKVKTKSPKKPRPAAPIRSPRVRSRYIPRAVVREVYARDGGRCSFVSGGGQTVAAVERIRDLPSKA